MVRRDRLRWFVQVERKSGDDWVSACRNVVVAGKGVAKHNFKRRQLSPPVPKNGGPGVQPPDFF